MDSVNELDLSYDQVIKAAFRSPMPPTLCHYTTWKGLQGILDERALWVVDFREQVTDREEFQHAYLPIVSLSREMAQDTRLSESERFLLSMFLGKYEQKHSGLVHGIDLFISCFCVASDNPELWGQFAEGHTGYAIEFSPAANDFASPGEGIESTLMVVDYSSESTARKIRGAFLEILRIYRTFKGADSRRAASFTRRALWNIAAHAAVQLKAPRDKNQQEWRLVVIRGPASPVQPSTDGKRHLSIGLHSKNAPMPLILAVHVGSEAPVGREVEIRDLLRRLNYVGVHEPPVIRSTLAR